ncbi:MAG TPA: hypothetical protein VM597_23260 [Gemmataceae bacterium]|nr:hypothetical protein [Gemmataceae bacterium]
MPARKSKQAESLKKGKPKSPAAPAERGYTSPAWERVYLMSMELAAVAKDRGLPDPGAESEGFDVSDAARELARLATLHDRAATPAGRTPAQEREDWIAVGGVGADLGNMADEEGRSAGTDGLREIAHELCYLVCDYLF